MKIEIDGLTITDRDEGVFLEANRDDQNSQIGITYGYIETVAKALMLVEQTTRRL